MPKITRYLIIGITTGFVLLTILKSFYYTNKNGAVDLRIRVVASRQLATDHSPYFYNWNPADGEYYLNPNDDAASLLNGNVVTPATLYLIYPVSWQTYPVAKVIWSIIQLILASFTVFLLLRNKTRLPSLVPNCIIVVGLLCTDIWLLNVERGQIYIFYTFLFAAMYGLYTSQHRLGPWFSGFIGGLFILFRPFAAIIALVFLLKGKRQAVVGGIAGFIFGCLIFVLPRPSLWTDYFKAMKEYASQYSGHSPATSGATAYVIPKTVEGVNNLSQAQEFNISRLDILYNYLKKADIIVSQNRLYVLYGLTIISLCFFFFRANGKDIPPQSLFLFAFLLYILAEFFVIVPRGNYNLIQWLFPISLIALQTKPYQPIFVLLIAGLLLLHNFPFVFPYQASMAELIFLGITIYCIFFAMPFNSLQQESNKT